MWIPFLESNSYIAYCPVFGVHYSWRVAEFQLVGEYQLRLELESGAKVLVIEPINLVYYLSLPVQLYGGLHYRHCQENIRLRLQIPNGQARSLRKSPQGHLQRRNVGVSRKDQFQIHL